MAILHTLWELVGNLGTLVYELVVFAWYHILLIVWLVWGLWGINWNRAWRFLAHGAWAPLLLLTMAAALAWSRIAPSHCDCLGLVTVPNFWWQLGSLGLLIALLFFCGWLQGVCQWAPADVNLNPPEHGHAHAHHGADHAHHGDSHGPDRGHGSHGDHQQAIHDHHH